MFKKTNKSNTGTTTGASTHSKGRGLAKLAGGLPILLLALSAFAVALAGVSVIRHEGVHPSPLPNSASGMYIMAKFLIVLHCLQFGAVFANRHRHPRQTPSQRQC